jgi:nicotinamide phosphoribosyltransferase
VRPDSGDPPSVVLRTLQILGEKFGTTENHLGYKKLPDCVRILQGECSTYGTFYNVKK